MSDKVVHISGDRIPELKEGCKFSKESLDELRKMVRDCEIGIIESLAYACVRTDRYATTSYIIPVGSERMILLGAVSRLEYRLNREVEES